MDRHREEWQKNKCYDNAIKEVTITYLNSWERLFNGWITLSTGSVTIQRIGVDKTDYVIHWIVLYSLDRVIHLLKNPTLLAKKFQRRDYNRIPSARPSQLSVTLAFVSMITTVIMLLFVFNYIFHQQLTYVSLWFDTDCLLM